jgi:hypothetical protein
MVEASSVVEAAQLPRSGLVQSLGFAAVYSTILKDVNGQLTNDVCYQAIIIYKEFGKIPFNTFAA